MITNTRGDVIETRNGDGNVNAKFVYDAWGKLISVTDGAGNALPETSFAYQISLKYRGYVYDNETGLYYLQSRYYDPNTGRFLNADSVDFISISNCIDANNLFVYCRNNAINYIDNNGYMAVKLLNTINRYYYTNSISITWMAILTILANGGGIYTAFHEIAQIVISKALYSKGMFVELEKKCGQGEIDIVANKKYIWEVKPLGTSAEKQLKKYTNKTGYVRGNKILTSSIKVKLISDLYMKITFNKKGGAFYAFYNSTNKRITNKALKEEFDAARKTAIGVASFFAVVAGVALIASKGTLVSGVARAAGGATGTIIYLFDTAAKVASKAA